MSRRAFVAYVATGTVGLSLPGCAARAPNARRHDLTRIEQATAGRLGVAAMNLTTDERLGHRGEERFAMCSTFKWILAALVLQRVDRGDEDLSRAVAFAESDLVTYSPVTKPRANGEGMTVGELCAATLATSDNTAANLLLDSMGGPTEFTAGLRALGDTVTRLDRSEPTLNENVPGDPRDTTTPRAMLALMRRMLFEEVLTPTSRDVLRRWMIASTTGRNRLRAGLGTGWEIGNRTGTNSNNQSNDLAFAIPGAERDARSGPLLVVSFLHAPKPSEADATHASVAREAMRALA